MSAQPWLSVILPTFQGERHLPRALESLAVQADALRDVLAADDGSTDGTLALLDRWRDRLPLRILPGPRAGNWVRGTNRALAEARGDWISLLHQDDAWQPQRVQALDALRAEFPTVGMFVTSARFWDDADRDLGRWGCPLPARRPLAPAFTLPRLATQNFIPLPAPCLRRDLAAAAGPLDETLWYFADWDWWLRLAARGPLVYTPMPTVAFRLHPDSQTARRTRDVSDVMAQFDAVQNRLMADPAFPPGRRAAARRMARFARCAYAQLLAAAHGARPDIRALLREALRLGPLGCLRYARDARLADRLPPRRRLRRLGRLTGGAA